LFVSLLDNPDDYYREMAAEGLARVGPDPAVLKPRFEQERKANVRNALAFALASADQDNYINDLANALITRQDYQVEAYLFELGKYEGKLNELHRYLRSANPIVRQRMVRIVGNIGDPASRPAIDDLTRDSNSDVAREALVALRKLTP
jgi:HEAT repeat protein